MRHKTIILMSILMCMISCTKDDMRNRFIIVAHQGYWKAAAGASNSLSGLTKSVELGIEGVELDVRRTLDDSLVLCHDGNFGKYDIAKSTFAQLRSVRLPDGSNMPSLREYAQLARQYGSISLFIDIKDISSVRDVIEVLEECNTTEQAVLMVPPSVIDEIRTINSQIRLFAMSDDVDLVAIKSSGASGVSMNINALKKQPAIIRDAHEKGLKVAAWVIKSESEIVWCSLNDIDYVITDSPKECKHYLYQ